MQSTLSPLAARIRGWRQCAALALLACATVPTSAAPMGMGVAAVVVSKSNCSFNAKNLLLQFNPIDPASTTDATASVAGRITCNGGQSNTVTLAFTLGPGKHSTGPDARRMQHTVVTTEYLAYSLSISPASANIKKNSSLDFTVTGTIRPFEFQDAAAGDYLDQVQIFVAP
jgi:spore coat protein U-like protein